MKTNKFIRLNVALKPLDEITKKLISLSREVAKNYESFFVLDGVDFFPHLTIYSPEYPESNSNKILKVVKDISHNSPKIVFRLEKVNDSQGFISLHFQLTPEIKQLHQKVVKKLNPLREGHIRERYHQNDYRITFSPEQLTNIEKYGYPDAMSLYHPHLTIIRLKDESIAKEIVNNIDWKVKELVAEKIAVYKMGQHGTCIELVEEFDLK